MTANVGGMTLPPALNMLAPVVVDDLIRVGKHNDGGYVVPRSALAATEVLIAMGVSTDWSFEEQFRAAHPAIEIHAYDHTVSRAHFRRGARHALAMFLRRRATYREARERVDRFLSFRRFFTGDVRHFPQRIHDRRERDDDATIATVFERVRSDKVFVKMDIEGSEYRVMDAFLAYAPRVIALAIEFHDTDAQRPAFERAVRDLKGPFEIVHIHGNNYDPLAADGLPAVLEIVFVRKGLCPATGQKRLTLPLAGLDEPNDPSRADYPLTFTP